MKNLENEKIAKNIEKIDKNIDFGGARNKRTSPSNSTRKTTYIDLFSCLYDRKWSKTLPIHVRKRSYVSVPNCMYACVFYALVLHGGVLAKGGCSIGGEVYVDVHLTHLQFISFAIHFICNSLGISKKTLLRGYLMQTLKWPKIPEDSSDFDDF